MDDFDDWRYIEQMASAIAMDEAVARFRDSQRRRPVDNHCTSCGREGRKGAQDFCGSCARGEPR